MAKELTPQEVASKTRRRKKRDQTLTDAGARFLADREGGFWVRIPVDEWTADLRVARVNGSIAVAELRVFPTAGRDEVPGRWIPETTTVPPGGLTARRVRQIPMGAGHASAVVEDWLSAILEALPDRGGIAVESSDGAKERAREVGRALLGWGEEAPNVPKPEPPSADTERRGRPKLSIAFLEGIARTYKAGGRYPALDIAEKYDVPRGTALGWVHKARKAGLLPRTTQGRASHSANPNIIKKATAHGLLNGASHAKSKKQKGESR